MEYELIDITFEPEELPLQNQMVRDDSELPFGPIEYDEDGIPKGRSLEEIRQRESLLRKNDCNARRQKEKHLIRNEMLYCLNDAWPQFTPIRE